MGADVIVPGLNSITTGTCFSSLGVFSSAQTSGNCWVNSLCVCLAHLVSLLRDRETSIHLESLPRGRVNGWLSPLKVWVFLVGKIICVPNLDSKSLPNKGTGHSGMYKNSWVTWCPPIWHFWGRFETQRLHLSPSETQQALDLLEFKVYRPSTVFCRTQRWLSFPLNHFRGFCHTHRFSGPPLEVL